MCINKGTTLLCVVFALRERERESIFSLRATARFASSAKQPNVFLEPLPLPLPLPLCLGCVRFAPKFLVSCFWVLELSLLDNIDKGNLSLPFYPSLVNLLFHLFLLLSTSNHLSCIVNPLFVHKKQVELTIISLVLIIAFGL